jgi:Ca2+-binding EF-hand superfamily protein
MKNCSKVMIAATILMGFASQSYASDSKQDKGQQPTRPDFSTVDTDSDGEISLDEFSEQKLPHGDYQTIFDEMDTDGDGVVSEEEFNNFKPPRPEKD